MKVLLIANNVPPEIAASFGVDAPHTISWIDALKDRLASEAELGIAFPFGRKTVEEKTIGSVRYIGFPRRMSKKADWIDLVGRFGPDLIHAFGTEKKHNYYLVRYCADRVPILLSLQGIMFACAQNYYAGLGIGEILKNYTLRDILFRDGIIAQKRRFKKQAKYEKYILQHVRHIEGRSDWDREMAGALNDDFRYYHCPRMIRSPFFDHRWSYDRCEKYSVFVHQGSYPLKGLHFLLDAIALLKKDYDVKLYIAGKNCFDRPTLKKKLSTPGYVRLINRRIKKYHLESNIIFTGNLDARTLAEKLSAIHVCVVPSAVENASNALAEAMIVGTPCVASYVGGNPAMLCGGQGGLLYCFNDVYMLRAAIRKYFDDPALCAEKSENAVALGQQRNNTEAIAQNLMNIYACVIENENA